MSIIKKTKKSKQEEFAKKTYAKKYVQIFDQLEPQYQQEVRQVYVDIPETLEIKTTETEEVLKEIKVELEGKTTESFEKIDNRIKGKRTFRRDFWTTALFIVSFVIALAVGFIFPMVFFSEWIWDKTHNIRFGFAFLPIIALLIILIIRSRRVKKNKEKIFPNVVISKINQQLRDKKEEGKIEETLKLKPTPMSRGSDTLVLREGSVRSCVIAVTIIAMIIFFVAEPDIENLQIPFHLLITFNLILVYYGFKPSAILPTPFVIDKSILEGDSETETGEKINLINTTEKLINSFPALKKAIKNIEDSFEEGLKKINEFNEKFKKDYETIFKEIQQRVSVYEENFNKYMDALKNIVRQKGKSIKDKKKEIEDLKSEIEENVKSFVKEVQEKTENIIEDFEEKTTKVGIVKDDIQSISFLSTKLEVKPRNKTEIVALIVLLLAIAALNIYYLSGIQDFYSALNISIASAFSAIALATGVALQELIYNFLQKPAKNNFSLMTNPTKNIRKNVGNYFEELDNYVQLVSDKSDKFVNAIFLPLEKTIDLIVESLEAGEKIVGEEIFDRANTIISQLITKNPFVTIETKLDEFEKNITEQYHQFMNRNFLEFLPVDISAILSLCALMSLLMMCILTPTLGLNHPVFMVIEFIAAYYFATKK